MPLYSYKCVKNNHTHNESRKVTEAPQHDECPQCGSLLKRVYSAPSIQFKGDGFYKTSN